MTKGGSEVRAFISYSSADRAIARRVAEVLRTRGASVWIDEGQLGPGDSLASSLAAAINAIEMFVIILTESAARSAWVKRELDIAITRMVEEGIQIVPLRCDDWEVPNSVRGLVWGDGRTHEGLAAALNHALRKQGIEFPLSVDSLERRHERRAPVDFAVRLVPTTSWSPDGFLGAGPRSYVFVGDYAEQAGRSLRQIQSSLGIGDAFDRVREAKLDWTAIAFEVGELNRRKLDVMPGTWKAVFRLLSATNRLALLVPSEEELKRLGKPPRDYYEGDQAYWRDCIKHHLGRLADSLLSTHFGLDDGCFDGSGRSNAKSPGVTSRLFLVRNSQVTNLNYRSQDLGSVDDGITLI